MRIFNSIFFLLAALCCLLISLSYILVEGDYKYLFFVLLGLVAAVDSVMELPDFKFSDITRKCHYVSRDNNSIFKLVFVIFFVEFLVIKFLWMSILYLFWRMVL